MTAALPFTMVGEFLAEREGFYYLHFSQVPMNPTLL